MQLLHSPMQDSILLQKSPQVRAIAILKLNEVPDSPAPNAVTLNASYLENSPAMGVVFVLLFTDDAGSVNFTKSLYLVLDRAESSTFLQNNVTQGRYDVLAFDVEEDGRLWSSPAVQETVTVGSEG